MSNFLKTFALLPRSYKNKSLLFIIFLILATFLETLGIGLIFPLIDLIINDNFTKNLFGIDLKSISLKYDKQDLVFNFLIFYIFLIIFKSLYLVFFSFWNNKFSQDLYKHLSEMLLLFYMNMDFSFYFKRNSSELLRNVIMECKNIGSIALTYLKLIVELVLSLSIIIVIFYIDPMISILTLGIFLFFSIVYFTLVKKIIYNYGLIRQSSSNEQIKTLQEAFSGIKDIKLKSLESFFQKIYYACIKKFTNAAYKSNTLAELPKILTELVFLVIVCVIVLYNSIVTSNIENIIPVIGLYAAVALKLIPSIAKLLSLSQNLQSLKPSIEVISNEIQIKKDTIKKEENKNVDNISFEKKIILKNITFSYDQNKILFKNLNLEIKKNSFVGIIGQSGKGKSTLIDLITGILTPLSGKIFVDDKDISSNIRSWQNKIGYVSQNIFLMDSTLKKNIAFGSEDNEINDKNIIQCCKDAMIYDFINSLKDKFHTKVGEKGIKLSGGQIQRLAIARELYRKPKLLILDEATSGLDEKTENEILEFLEKIKGKITVIIVSHRKNTIKNCNEILDLSKQN
tara:strand:+ start:2874 stop:4580 length:1707 start_codon:yes stop_codon:yes gene_type:complete